MSEFFKNIPQIKLEGKELLTTSSFADKYLD